MIPMMKMRMLRKFKHCQNDTKHANVSIATKTLKLLMNLTNTKHESTRRK